MKKCIVIKNNSTRCIKTFLTLEIKEIVSYINWTDEGSLCAILFAMKCFLNAMKKLVLAIYVFTMTSQSEKNHTWIPDNYLNLQRNQKFLALD